MALLNVLAASILAASLNLTSDVTLPTDQTPVNNTTPSATRIALKTGEPAPDFVFRSHEYGWRRLRDVLGQGRVLLVFGGSDSQLRSLQSSYHPLMESGVVPMVVTGLGSDAAWKAIQRCEVSFSLLSDPGDEIATQFGLATPEFQGWYLIDEKGRVRGHGPGWVPSQDWTAITSHALGDGDAQALGEE